MTGPISFAYESFPIKVQFGQGASERVGDQVESLGARKVFLVASKRFEPVFMPLLSGYSPTLFPRAVQHTPVEVTADALSALRHCDADLIVAVGGGAAIGLAKALALRTDLRYVAVPTTYSGSEMTAVVGEVRNREKLTTKKASIRATAVIYDPRLTVSLDPMTSVASAFNSIAHGVEALYARDNNPIVTFMASTGINALTRAVPELLSDARSMAARSDALYGAWLCGYCLGSTTMGLHHQLCHTLGGLFDLPHANTHAISLAYSLAYNEPAVPDAIRVLRETLGGTDPVSTLFGLLQRSGLVLSLRELGMPAEGIDAAADAVLRKAYDNPRPLERGGIRELLQRAFDGSAPR